jgi:hypothetical protein
MAQPVSPLPNRGTTPAQQPSPLETVEPRMPVAPAPSPNPDNSPLLSLWFDIGDRANISLKLEDCFDGANINGVIVAIVFRIKDH